MDFETLDIRLAWETNAPAWTSLSRAGYNIFRDEVNDPDFFATIPDVSGLRGLDVGCGEGHCSRELARLGASMVVLDISKRFATSTRESAISQNLDVGVVNGTACSLPLRASSMEFAVSVMSLMDVESPVAAMHEIRRVLKPGAFFLFSILHPCFSTWRHSAKVDEAGAVTLTIDNYFDAKSKNEQWMFGSLPEEVRSQWPKFTIPHTHRTLSFWIQLISDSGFHIKALKEPHPSDECVKHHPQLASASRVPFFLLFLCIAQ